MSESDQFWLKRFEAYLQEHHASPTLSVPELAEAFALSESSLLRQVKRLVGFTPVHYLRQIRLQQAWHLLRSGTYPSVQQVAFAVGYRNTRSFTRSFKEQYGQPPSNFLLR
jgi:AraC-like DNA-binding protein